PRGLARPPVQGHLPHGERRDRRPPAPRPRDGRGRGRGEGDQGLTPEMKNLVRCALEFADASVAHESGDGWLVTASSGVIGPQGDLRGPSRTPEYDGGKAVLGGRDPKPVIEKHRELEIKDRECSAAVSRLAARRRAALENYLAARDKCGMPKSNPLQA